MASGGREGTGGGGQTEKEKQGKTSRKGGTGSKGENNPPWPGRNSPVPFPAGFLTSHCVRARMDVCVSCRPFGSASVGDL